MINDTNIIQTCLDSIGYDIFQERESLTVGGGPIQNKFSKYAQNKSKI